MSPIADIIDIDSAKAFLRINETRQNFASGGGSRDLSREELVRDLLGLPAHIRVLCAFSLGTPATEGSNRGPGPMANVHREQW